MPELFFMGHGGVRLAADRFGIESAPQLLLVPGGGQTRRAWKRSAQTFAESGFCAYTIDLRGHGDSEWSPDGDYSLDVISADMCNVMTELGRKPTVIGASLGGLALLVAIADNHDAEELASGLVLVDVAHRLEESGRRRIRRFMLDHAEGFATLEDVADALAQFNPDRPRTTNLAGLRTNLRETEDGRLVWHWDPRFVNGDREAALESGPVGDLSRIKRAARRLTLPTLLVRGKNSDVVSREAAEAFARIVPKAELIDVTGAGHTIAGDRNDVFNQAILTFLHRQGGTDRPAHTCPFDGAGIGVFITMGTFVFGTRDYFEQVAGKWRELFEEHPDLSQQLAFSQSYRYHNPPAAISPNGDPVGFHYRWDRGNFDWAPTPDDSCDIVFDVDFEVARRVWTGVMVEPEHLLSDPADRQLLIDAQADGRFVRLDKREIPPWFRAVHNRIAELV